MTNVSVQLPQRDVAPVLPGSGANQPVPVPDWERGPARARANCPTRASASRDDHASSRTERIGQEIRVVLVDDHLSFRQPLAFMLMREPNITIIGQAGTVAEARTLLPEADIALIDLDLPDGEGIDLIEDLRSINPKAMALVLTGNNSDLAMARAVEAGAAGVIHKSRPVSEITDAIRRLHAGEALLSVRETMDMFRLVTQQREQDRATQATVGRLTPREHEVLQTLGAGLSDRQIAERLVVSIETVRTHMVNVLAKLGVDSRLKALVFGLQHGLVTIT
jgi:DNA-binding NarL/FixJ family response regulator